VQASFVQGSRGPLRAGIFATATSSRAASGASYWGIMEMSGNLAEGVVGVGTSSGRTFTGLHGDGTLSAAGEANVANWPRGSGLFLRGGWYDSDWSYPMIADRTFADGTAITDPDERLPYQQFRGVTE
jgi:hypothetical protein